MPRFKRFGFMALFVAFTLIGLAIAAFGETHDRPVGAAVALFFGGAGAMWYVVSRKRARAPTGFRIGTVTLRGGVQPAFIAQYSRGRLLAVATGALAMAGGAAVLAFFGDGDPVEHLLLGGAALGIGVVGVAILLRARGGYVALTRSSLIASNLEGRTAVDWDSITAYGELVMHDNPMLAIRVADPSLIRTGRVSRFLHRFDRSLTGADVTLPLRLLDVTPTALYGAIIRYVDQPDARGRIGTEAELADLGRAAVALEDQVRMEEPEVERLRRPFGRRMASWAVGIVGMLLALFAVVGIFADAGPNEERNRLIGVGIITALAASHLVAAALVARGVRLGRWLGIGSLAVTAGLGILAAVNADDAPNAAGLVLAGIAIGSGTVLVLGTRQRSTAT